MSSYALLVSIPVLAIIGATIYMVNLARTLPNRNEDFNVYRTK